jgi:putative transposase
MNGQTNDNFSEHLIKILLNQGLSDGLVTVAQMLMNSAMLIERERHVGVAPNKHSTERNGYANGFKPRKFQTSMGELDLAIPQVRGSSETFRTSLLEKGSRSDRALKSAIATMYVEGVSTRRVTRIVEELCGFEVSSTQVSNLNKQLDDEFRKWRERELEEMRYLIVDATYYKVRIDGAVRDCATLIAIGVRRSDNKRVVLGVSCAISEAEVHWRNFFNSLKQRGVGIPDYIVSDAHDGLRAALKASFSGSYWQRCQFHLQQNAQNYITNKNLKSLIANEISAIFNADSLNHAQQRLNAFVKRWEKDQPKLAIWAEANLQDGFAVFKLPESHRKKMRTSNSAENLNSQIKRRTRVARIFPSEESLERLVTGVLIEISENWESGKAYLNNEQN